MGRIFFFLVGFVWTFLKMLIGAVVINAIVGFFFMPALYVLVPISIISIVVEAFKGGTERASEFAYGKQLKKQSRKSQKQINKLKGIFKDDELFEFDKAWKQMSRSLD